MNRVCRIISGKSSVDRRARSLLSSASLGSTSRALPFRVRLGRRVLLAALSVIILLRKPRHVRRRRSLVLKAVAFTFLGRWTKEHEVANIRDITTGGIDPVRSRRMEMSA
jgi:hypothetical protein